MDLTIMRVTFRLSVDKGGHKTRGAKLKDIEIKPIKKSSCQYVAVCFSCDEISGSQMEVAG